MPELLIVTAGGMGDVAPYTGLGAGLRDAGFDVSIATHDAFAGAVKGAGLGFRSLPENPLRLGLPDDAPSDQPKPGFQEGMKAAEDRIWETAEAILAAARAGADVLLFNAATAPLGIHVAEGLGLPSMGVYLAPPGPTKEFPPVYIPGSLGALGNRAAWRVVDGMADAFLVSKPAKRLRSELGLAPITPRALRKRQADEAWPICCGFSPAVVPQPADWRPGIEVVGYWWPLAPEGWEPPAELTAFLADGPPPVYVGFGSLGKDGERLADLVPRALRAAGVRGVVQAAWGELLGDADDVLAIGSAPHDWLFPQMAAVVHAAGAGVAAAALKAGVASVPVPVDLDQPFWARRLALLGAGTDPIPFKKLTAESLTAAVRTAVSTPGYAAKAADVAARLAQEDGTARTVETARRVAAALAR
jgi:UDP:flavonoid glycosyltransferase YjiC (YdhE family)